MPVEQIALQVHIATIIALVCVILYTDHLGLMWMLGKKEVLNAKRVTLLHTLVWAGLLLMLASGFTMFLSYKDFLLFEPVFYVKALFVVTLVVNAFFIGTFMRAATERSFATLTRNEKVPLVISGAISTIGWIGAITCGLILSSLI
jgi:nitrate reductase gamma subunit